MVIIFCTVRFIDLFLGLFSRIDRTPFSSEHIVSPDVSSAEWQETAYLRVLDENHLRSFILGKQ
jgi:hypothetical protein